MPADTYHLLVENGTRDVDFSPTGLSIVRKGSRNFEDLPTIQFAAPYYIVEEGIDSKAYIDVYRIGNSKQLDRVSCAEYETFEESAVAGRDYKTARGIIEFAKGDAMQTIVVDICDNSFWNTSEEFQVEIVEGSVSGAILGHAMSSTRVKIVDNNRFPNDRYLNFNAENHKSTLALWLPWNYFVMNFFNDTQIFKGTIRHIVVDFVFNLWYLLSLLMGVYLFDYIVDNKTPVGELLLVHDRKLQLLIFIGIKFVALFMKHGLDYVRLSFGIGGASRNFLSCALIRNYLNYTNTVRADLDTSRLVLAIHRDTAIAVRSYFLILRLFYESMQLITMVIFNVMSIYLFDDPLDTYLIVPPLCFPIFMALFLYVRKGKTVDVLDARNDGQDDIMQLVQQTTENCSIILDHGLASFMTTNFRTAVDNYSDKERAASQVMQNNVYFPKWGANLIVGSFIYFGGQRLFDGSLSFGIFNTNMDVTENWCVAVTDIFLVIVALFESIPSFCDIAGLVNLPLDTAQRKALNVSNMGIMQSNASMITTLATMPKNTDSEKMRVAVDMIPIVCSLTSCNITHWETGVNNINLKCHFEVMQGSLVLVMGGKGSGKDTLLKLIARRYLPDLSNGELLAIPEHLRILSSAENPVFFRNTLLYNLTLGMADDDPEAHLERVSQICKTLGLSERTLRYLEKDDKEVWVELFSQSEVKLLGIARALVSNFELICFHKPLTGMVDADKLKVMDAVKNHMEDRGLYSKLSVSEKRPRTVFMSIQVMSGILANYTKDIIVQKRDGMRRITEEEHSMLLRDEQILMPPKRRISSALDLLSLEVEPDPDSMPVLQFSAPYYIFEEGKDDEAHLIVYRIGSKQQLARKSSVMFETSDDSAVAGRDYEHTRGRIDFAEFEGDAKVIVKLRNNEFWNTTEEFKVELLKDTVTGAVLGHHMAETLVKIVDNNYFPVDSYADFKFSDHRSAMAQALPLRYFLMNLRNSSRILRGTINYVLVDIVHNLFYLFSLVMGVYLFDYIVEKERSADELFLIHDRKLQLFAFASIKLVIILVKHILDYAQLEFGIEGASRNFLTCALVRKYLNFAKKTRGELDTSEFIMAIHRDAQVCVDSYFLVLQLIFEITQLGMMVTFRVLSVFLFSANLERRSLVGPIVYPIFMLLFLWFRRGKTVDSLDRRNDAQDKVARRLEETTVTCSVMLDHGLGWYATNRFKKAVVKYNGKGKLALQILMNNTYFPRWAAQLLVGGFIYFGGQQLFAGEISIGLFVTNLGVFESWCQGVEDIFMIIISLFESIPCFCDLAHIFNLPIDVSERKAIFEMQKKEVKGTKKVLKNRSQLGSEAVAVDLIRIVCKLDSVTILHWNKLDHLKFKCDFEISQGSLAVILGPKGTGKDTVLRLIARRLLPELAAGDCLTIPEHLRILSSAETPVFFRETLYNNLTFGMRSNDPDASVERVAKICEVLGVSDRALNRLRSGEARKERLEEQFSTTERKRLGLARALVNNFEITCFHKPLTAIATSEDEKLVMHVLKKHIDDRGLYCSLSSNQKRPRTIIMTAHIWRAQELAAHTDSMIVRDSDVMRSMTDEEYRALLAQDGME